MIEPSECGKSTLSGVFNRMNYFIAVRFEILLMDEFCSTLDF
ncbi:MAG: hypothetical protein PHO40_03050 [Candidatus Omnitrophica bacterium]|nr:hypothetical protein [Candidatus Omnitrophota bacterium]